jgi:hypothetical protein
VRVTLVEDSSASSDQEFKSLVEIRNANLRGAKIDEVDFYLIDLRGAMLDSRQVIHLRRCGASLETHA